MKLQEYFLYAKQKNDYSTIHLNENRISKSLVALRAGTLQILVAQKCIYLTSLNKKVINVNQKHFQYTKINKYQGKSFILRAHKRCFIRHYRQDKKKCQRSISEDSRFPSEIHSQRQCFDFIKRAALIFIQ